MGGEDSELRVCYIFSKNGIWHGSNENSDNYEITNDLAQQLTPIQRPSGYAANLEFQSRWMQKQIQKNRESLVPNTMIELGSYRGWSREDGIY